MNRTTIPPPADTLGKSSSRSSALTALSHPLPAGMRDLLPWEAESQGALVRRILDVFELVGFQQVGLPVFEYTEVLERGLGSLEPSSMLRFVEPETGEVVALRPDMTPQVARLLATRLPHGPFPARLCYRGSVLRRTHQRARHDQQVLQAGIELIGASGLQADLEVLDTTARAVRAAGLSEFVIDLGHGALAASLLEDIPAEERRTLVEALSQKDQAELVLRADKSSLSRERARQLSALVELHGTAEVFERGRKALAGSPALGPLAELEELHRLAAEAGIAPLVVDLGETSAVAYYSGPMFQLLAEGPGQAVASGGRYDNLFSSFGLDLPAAGAAIHVDHLRWAIGPSAAPESVRVLVVPSSDGEESFAAVRAALEELRAAQIPCARAESRSALDYARAWRYSHLVRLTESGSARLVRLEAAREVDLGELSLSAAIERLRA